MKLNKNEVYALASLIYEEAKKKEKQQWDEQDKILLNTTAFKQFYDTIREIPGDLAEALIYKSGLTTEKLKQTFCSVRAKRTHIVKPENVIKYEVTIATVECDNIDQIRKKVTGYIS